MLNCPLSQHFGILLAVWRWLAQARWKMQQAKARHYWLPRISTEATIGLSPASRILDIASKVLDAKISTEKHDYQSAIQLLEKLLAAEDTLDSVEPLNWYFPTRESLGSLLLARGDYREAKKVFRADLEKYPHNGRSLFSLEASLQAMGKEDAAQVVKAELETTWKDQRILDFGF